MTGGSIIGIRGDAVETGAPEPEQVQPARIALGAAGGRRMSRSHHRAGRPALAILLVASLARRHALVVAARRCRRSDRSRSSQFVAALCGRAGAGRHRLAAAPSHQPRGGAALRRDRARRCAPNRRRWSAPSPRSTAAIDSNRVRLADQVAALAAMGETANERLAATRARRHRRGRAGRCARAQLRRIGRRARRRASASCSPRCPARRPRPKPSRSRLEQTGLSASEHAAALDAALAALAERGREADAVAGGAAQRLARPHHPHGSDQRDRGRAAGGGHRARCRAQVDALLGRTADAVDEARKGIAAQGDAMLALIGANQAALDQAARAGADALAERIAAVDGAIERVAARLDVQREAGDAIVASLETGLARVDGQMDALHAQGDRQVAAARRLDQRARQLGRRDDRVAASAGESMAIRTIGTTESLLIALDSAAREIDETLPEALARLDERIADQPQGGRRGQARAARARHRGGKHARRDRGDRRRHRRAAARRSTRCRARLLETLTAGPRQGGCARRRWSTRRSAAPTASPRKPRRAWSTRCSASATPPRPPPSSARETLATVIPEAAARAGGRERRRDAPRDHRHASSARSARSPTRPPGAVDAATRATERLAAQVAGDRATRPRCSKPASRRRAPSARSTTATPSPAACRC